ncbi:MAG: ATP synthase subunit I [Pseudomonadota bacterium]
MDEVTAVATTQKQTPLAKWWATVGTAIALQWLTVLTLTAAAWAVAGTTGAASLFGGGAAVALANTVLALWLTLRVAKVGVLSPTAMLGGEMLKLGLTAALLVLVAAKLKPLMWLALIVGVIAALKAQWLALWFTRKA